MFQLQIFRVYRIRILFLLICSSGIFYYHPVSAFDKITSPLPDGHWCHVSFPGAAVTDVHTIYIPFTLAGQLIMVEARVDSQVGLFMLDTGAEHLLLNSAYFSSSLPSRNIAAIGNTGTVGTVNEKYIDSVMLDQLAIHRIYAHLVDLQHIERKKNIRLLGILGYEVCKDFELFIDFQNRRIVLSRLDRQGNRLDSMANWERPYDSLEFELKNHLIMIDAEINAVRVKMILDSGAELNLIDRRVNRKVLDRFTIIKRVNLVGIGKKEVEVLAGVLEGVQCGNQLTEKMNTLLTSMDDINRSLGVSAKGVLGYEFLKTRRTLINYKKRKLYFFNPVKP